MFCCCDSKDSSSSYSVGNGDSGKAAQPVPANSQIKTGKGPLSSSNQNLGPEASLDKGTIASAQQDRKAVTEQPIQSSSAGAANQSQPSFQSQLKKEQSSTENKPVDISNIEAQIIKSEDNTVTEHKPVEKPVFVSTVNVKSNTDNKGRDTTGGTYSQELASINSKLDNLEEAITDVEVESKSVCARKSAVPDLAFQLKALNTQVSQVISNSGNKMADKKLQDVVSRLESVATRLESLAAGGGGGGSGGASTDEVASFVIAYDDFMKGSLAEYFSLSNAIGGEVKTQAEIVRGVFDVQREFLNIASKSKQPDQGTLLELLQPSSTKLQAVQDFREKNRGRDCFNHLSTISESIAALGWVTVSPAPGPYVKELTDASTFYLNRITKIVKDKNPQHSAWGKAWAAALKDLQAYIKAHHTTGVSWNPKGGDARAVKAGGPAAPPPPAGGAPPPPPPPPAPSSDDAAAGGGGADSRSALFTSINKGEGVTQGLKKVTNDMKTHKNPALRQGPAPFKPKPAAKPVPSPAPKPSTKAVKPPVLELQQGKKWIIEYQKDNKNIVLTDTEMRHTVYIYKCEGSVINIKGKVNSITMDSCKKTGLVFEDVLSSVEFVNCQSVQGQVTGKVSTMSIDKTDGCMIYLSQGSMGVEIVTAKSSEMNVLVPQGADRDYKEFSLPEQFKTTYNKSTGTVKTTATDSI